MHVVQTDGDPPSSGSTILANIGWTRNRSKALAKSAAEKMMTTGMYVGIIGRMWLPPSGGGSHARRKLDLLGPDDPPAHGQCRSHVRVRRPRGAVHVPDHD